jgi:hypothetical protein
MALALHDVKKDIWLPTKCLVEFAEVFDLRMIWLDQKKLSRARDMSRNIFLFPDNFERFLELVGWL